MATASDAALVFALKAEPGVLLGVMPRKGYEVAYAEGEQFTVPQTLSGDQIQRLQTMMHLHLRFLAFIQRTVTHQCTGSLIAWNDISTQERTSADYNLASKPTHAPFPHFVSQLPTEIYRSYKMHMAFVQRA
jgi:hypothetical protein